MDFVQKNIRGLWIIKPNLICDERGYISEVYKKESFEYNIGKVNFIQENQSRSLYGVLRGLHFQEGNGSQAKLITVLEGKIQDVAVDLRKNSDSFGYYEIVELSFENKWQFFIPRGFAHGFLVTSPWATVSYKVDNHYQPNNEWILYAGDKQVNIPWHIKCVNWKQSQKDKFGRSFKEIRDNLFYERNYSSRRKSY